MSENTSSAGGGAAARPRTLYLMKQVQYKTYFRLEEALRPLGITSAQFRIMTTLRDHARRSSADLARMFGVKPQTMIKQIGMLEERGLVQREVAADNRRVLEVRLSAKGEIVLARATEEAIELERSLFAALGEGQLEQYREIMMRLLDSLERAEGEAEEYELIPGQLSKSG